MQSEIPIMRKGGTIAYNYVVFIITTIGFSCFDQCYDKYLDAMNNFKRIKIEPKGNEDNGAGSPSIILSSDEIYILLIGGVFPADKEQDDDGYIAKIQENKFNKMTAFKRTPN